MIIIVFAFRPHQERMLSAPNERKEHFHFFPFIDHTCGCFLGHLLYGQSLVILVSGQTELSLQKIALVILGRVGRPVKNNLSAKSRTE